MPTRFAGVAVYLSAAPWAVTDAGNRLRVLRHVQLLCGQVLSRDPACWDLQRRGVRRAYGMCDSELLPCSLHLFLRGYV